MQFRKASAPTPDELREWAYDPESPAPMQDWDLVLSWQMDRGLLRHAVRFASDPDCPASEFFLQLLYQWIATVARDEQFEIKRLMYDGWLSVARGVRHPAVKQWRHAARLILQGVEPFDWEHWWAKWSVERDSL